MAELRRRVIGTAGHVDHGKTALVKALTGVDCDRLEEEQRRGITIALGFATWLLADDLAVSVVDVPGHERFVHTMVSGASGLDAVLLVVAADDGVMPQTREHLQICQLLGVRRGVVAITKRDLVDDEMLELVREDVRDAVAGTFLDGAPVHACSAHTGDGIEALVAAVRQLLETSERDRATGPAFLPVDRAFTKAGFGTVVTGTLLSGGLSVGDAVTALPGPRGEGRDGLRVRGLQIQEQAVEVATAGVRLALNLRGPQAEALRRGEVIVSEGAQLATRQLHVELSLLPAASPIEERAQLSLHLGAGAELVQASPLGGRLIAPGSSGLARLVCERPVAAYVGQRFVLRQPGRHGLGTIGGGRVLDPHPGTGKGSFKRWHRVAAALAQPELEGRLRALLEDAREAGLSARELARRLAPAEDASAALQALVAAGQAIVVESGGEQRHVDAARVERLGALLLEVTRRFHTEHPVLAGVSPAELKSQLPPLATWLAEAAVARLIDGAALRRVGSVVALPDHSPDKQVGAGALQRVAARYRSAGLKPPLDDELRAELDLKPALFRDVLNELKRRDTVERLAENLHFDREALRALRTQVEAHFAREPELSPARLKEMGGGLSRKWAIPLLEWLDREGVTTRKGDVRIARAR